LYWILIFLEVEPRPSTTARARNETADEKRARKSAVKQQRATRRADKKASKEVFGKEFNKQKKQQIGLDIEKGMRKL
jgi:protein LTV1